MVENDFIEEGYPEPSGHTGALPLPGPGPLLLVPPPQPAGQAFLLQATHGLWTEDPHAQDCPGWFPLPSLLSSVLPGAVSSNLILPSTPRVAQEPGTQ